MDKARVEELAAHCHNEQWAGWMRYLFEKCTSNPDGSVSIPAWAVKRWSYQMNTPYSELPEGMRETDRVEARQILSLLGTD